MSSQQYDFSPAYELEKTVYGAHRPGYPSRYVGLKEVQQWISFMQAKGIQRVCCLLPKAQLEYYLVNLLALYRGGFGVENVCWAPVEDFHLIPQDTLQQVILPFMFSAQTNEQKMVIHCSSGRGRTGVAIAAWLVYARDFSVEKALKTVSNQKDFKREPFEAMYYGNANRHELDQLLETCKPKDSSKSI